MILNTIFLFQYTFSIADIRGRAVTNARVIDHCKSQREKASIIVIKNGFVHENVGVCGTRDPIFRVVSIQLEVGLPLFFGQTIYLSLDFLVEIFTLMNVSVNRDGDLLSEHPFSCLEILGSDKTYGYAFVCYCHEANTEFLVPRPILALAVGAAVHHGAADSAIQKLLLRLTARHTLGQVPDVLRHD